MKITEILSEMRDRRDSWTRDYDSSVSGMGKHDSLAYQLDGGANDEGWDKEEWKPRPRQSYKTPHDVYIDGRKWKNFDSFDHANNVAKKLKANGKNATVKRSLEENATAGATSAANVGTVVNPHHSPGKARGKKSYLGSPGTGSGTKAPPQPKVVQPKNADGTAKNGLEMGNIFGSGAKQKR